MSANANGGSYAPLKQIITDSESEEDRRLNMPRIRTTDSCETLDINSGLQASKNCSLSDLDDGNTNVNTVSSLDNVSFLQSDFSSKMSFPRRCAFIGSIFMCLFTAIVFLWGIPCSDVGRCQVDYEKKINWELPYDEIELSGAVQVVEGATPSARNLIFIYRGNHMHDKEKNKPNVNGVIQIVGKSGKVGWYTRERRIPTEINCQLLDVNRDGQNDCIVSGTSGWMAALNPLSGTYYWTIHKQGKFMTDILAIDFPILLKDMDRDKVNDLLSVATVLPSKLHNFLLIISGATGSLIGDPLPINDCSSVKLLSDTDTINITFICKNGTAEAVRMISYPLLYRKMMKIDHETSKRVKATSLDKDINLSLKKNIGNTREVFINGPRKLIVENSGECPDSCKVNLKLIHEKNGVTNVTWEYSANYVYAMRPSSFAFMNNIRGFVLKL